MGYKRLYLSSHVEIYYEKLDFRVKMRLENGDNLFERILKKDRNITGDL